MGYFDKLETRSADERQAAIAKSLPETIAAAKEAPIYVSRLNSVDATAIRDVDDLGDLPVFRKSEMSQMQRECPPFGGLTPGKATDYSWIFQSPGPIYEPGMVTKDWWRMGRFLHACGITKTDIVLNCLSYHFTPAGMMFESGARAVGATVVPSGPGQSEFQARAAADIGVTSYAGTPDFLKVILDKAIELGIELPRLTKAAVGGGALFPSLRQEYADRGIHCLQVYATAELGNIAYETVADEGLIVEEGVIVEILYPGSSEPVDEGMTGEVVVTLLNPDYPLVRFATGDLSSVVQGQSPCGRTNLRLAGWKGRADQTTKVKGMFVRPEQVAEFVRRHKEIVRARVEVNRKDEMDDMIVLVEAREANINQLERAVAEAFKLRARVELRPPGSLPDDGKVINDQRSYS